MFLGNGKLRDDRRYKHVRKQAHSLGTCALAQWKKQLHLEQRHVRVFWSDNICRDLVPASMLAAHFSGYLTCPEYFRTTYIITCFLTFRITAANNIRTDLYIHLHHCGMNSTLSPTLAPVPQQVAATASPTCGTTSVERAATLTGNEKLTSPVDVIGSGTVDASNTLLRLPAPPWPEGHHRSVGCRQPAGTYTAPGATDFLSDTS